MSNKKVAELVTVGWAIPAVMMMLDVLGGKNPRKYERIAAFVFGCLCFVGMIVFYTYIMKIEVVTAIFVCFLITIIPTATYTGVVGINTFLPKGIPGLTETSIEIFYAIMVTLTMANSGINPLICYLRNPKFKESLPKYLKTFGPLNCPSTEN